MEFRPFKLFDCSPPAEPLPRGPPAHRRAKGVAVSLGTPTNRHSQIRRPTCSGRLHYFSLLNPQVTQEQGVGPGLTLKTEFLPGDRHPKEAARSTKKPCAPWYSLLTCRLGIFIPSLGTLPPGSNQGLDKSWEVGSPLAAQGHGSLQATTKASRHLHTPWSQAVSKPTDYPLTNILLPTSGVRGGDQTGRQDPCQLGAYPRPFKAA